MEGELSQIRSQIALEVGNRSYLCTSLEKLYRLGLLQCIMVPCILRVSDLYTMHKLIFLNQARAGRRLARAWFLKIDPVRIVGMRICVSAPEAINN